MTQAQPTFSAAPAAARSTPRWIRRVAGVALASLGSVLALSIGVQTLFASAPLACGSDCAGVLAQSRFAIVLGVPAMAWAAALHAVLALTTWTSVLAPRRFSALIQAAQLGLVLVLLGGSATYLVLGLVTDVRCQVCFAMHVLAVVAALGVAIGPRPHRDDGVPPLLERAAALGLALAAWVALGWGLAQLGSHTRAARAAPMASTDAWLAAVCEPASCPAGAHFGPEAMPEDDASIVLGRGPGPTLVAWLDLGCAACRADFKAEEPLFRERVRTGSGLRLVLRGGARACDARAQGGDARQCEAPTAVLCAARHAGAEAALDLLGWELQAEPGYYSKSDRRQALSAMSPLAARCFDSELSLGAHGALAAHAEAARRIEERAKSHPGCGAEGEAAWWCFSGTPAFAIVHSRPPSPDGARSAPFATSLGALRRAVLERCLEPRP